MTTETITLPGNGPGTSHALTVLRFGTPGARPRVYVQGGLHADEAPGMLAASALAMRLRAAERDGRIAGEITVVPCANPIGLAQRALGHHVGRFDLGDGMNFNRGFPDLAPAAGDRVEGRLGPDAAANTTAIRAALTEAHAALVPSCPAERLKHALLGLALGADYVLDLHCDAEAEVHLYTLTPQAGDFAPLAALLGARAVLLADVSGLNPFDEALSRPFADLAARFPGHPVPLACRAATVELRGQADVEPHLAEADADALLGFLVHAGAVRGQAPAIPAPLCEATPLAGSEPVTAPVAGLVVPLVPTGARVAAGEAVAEILDPLAGTRTAVAAGTDGILYARSGARVAAAGTRLAKIAGATPTRTGPLLSP